MSSTYVVEYKPNSPYGDREWINADWEDKTYETLEKAEARNRLPDYEYRIVEITEPKVVREYPVKPKPATQFEVGECYAHVNTPDNFQYWIAYEFKDGRFLLTYVDNGPYGNSKLVSLKYQPNTAKYFIKKV